MSETRAFYFGTYLDAGHYLWDQDWHRTRLPHRDGRDLPWAPLPWPKIDGKLNPSAKQGEAALHHKDGWTALAFANYVDDSRPGSNSAFFFEGRLTFKAALAAAKARFPHVIERMNFEIWDTAVGLAPIQAGERTPMSIPDHEQTDYPPADWLARKEGLEAVAEALRQANADWTRDEDYYTYMARVALVACSRPGDGEMPTWGAPNPDSYRGGGIMGKRPGDSLAASSQPVSGGPEGKPS